MNLRAIDLSSLFVNRAKQVRLFYDQLFIKEPGTRTETPWHNDHSYWPLIGDQVVSLWLALDYVPKSACVQYVKGSHKWKMMHK
jgi:ectoine hydroxylase-related dioxygenase (phytanoyl-CoA dioxygenase family)